MTPSGPAEGRFAAPTTVTPLAVTMLSPGFEPSTLPPSALAPRSTTTDPARMPASAVADTSSGGRRPGTWAVVMTMSNLLIAVFSASCCACRSSAVSSRAYPPSPTAGHLDTEVEEGGPGGQHVPAGGVPDVVPGDDRAEPAGRADRLQAGHPGADHQDQRRPGRPGRGHEHRQVVAVGVGGHQRRLVAGDVGLRAERVHRLRPADRPGQAVQADGGHLRDGERGRELRIGQRLEQPHQYLARAQQLAIGFRGWLHTEHRIRAPVQLLLADQSRPGGLVLGVRETTRCHPHRPPRVPHAPPSATARRRPDSARPGARPRRFLVRHRWSTHSWQPPWYADQQQDTMWTSA